MMSADTQEFQSNENNKSGESALENLLQTFEASDETDPAPLNLNEQVSEHEEDAEERSNDEEEEEEEEEASSSTEEELAALELIRQRHEARLLRQAQTRTRLAEITARLQEKKMLRHRWLPAPIVRPLRTFLIHSGLFSNLTEAALFSLGICALLVSVSLGLWWRHFSWTWRNSLFFHLLHLVSFSREYTVIFAFKPSTLLSVCIDAVASRPWILVFFSVKTITTIADIDAVKLLLRDCAFY